MRRLFRSYLTWRGTYWQKFDEGRWKLRLAIAGLNRLRYDNFAPCDIDESHLVMSAHYTL